jgi:hypothetical protein
MTTSFINQVSNIAPTIRRQLQECPQIMPNRDQLIGLKPKLNALKAWFASRGQDGNLSVLSDCTVFGLLDKENLPTNVIGWTNWALNLDAQVNSAIASVNVEGANVVNRNLVNDRFLNTPNANESFVNTASNAIANTANQVLGWWNKPIFQVYTYSVTPMNLAIMYGVYYVVSKRK